ncbi:ferritin-like domain-containing protein [Microbacterium sp. C23T]
MNGKTPVVPVGANASTEHPFDRWVTYFTSNRARHEAIEASVNWDSPADLPDDVRTAIVHSFQRFELGEGGDGQHLLRKASGCGAAQREALRMLVVEEQLHSELFKRGLQHLGASPLPAHWSDRAFTHLRRLLGLRIELALFLAAEAVAMPYFVMLARSGPDEVVRAIGTRIALDEEHHLAFQIDQLRVGFASTPTAARVLVFVAWWSVAVGAATVVALDHRAALRACGLTSGSYWGFALRSFRRAAAAALTSLSP